MPTAIENLKLPATDDEMGVLALRLCSVVIAYTNATQEVIDKYTTTHLTPAMWDAYREAMPLLASIAAGSERG